MKVGRCVLKGLSVCLWFFGAVRGADRTADLDMSPAASDNFYQASGRILVPGDGFAIRGILVLLGGTDSDHRDVVVDPEWREFARNEHIAILGCCFRGDGDPYEQASAGSGRALLNMIDQASEILKDPALSRLPLLLVGHSSGAMFAYNFASWMPERVIAFVLVKSGPIKPAGNSRVTTLPALFIVGERDSERLPFAARVFLWQSAPYRRWAFAVEPGKGHEWTDQDADIARTFLQGILSGEGSNLVSKVADAGLFCGDSIDWLRRDLRFPSRVVAASEISGANLVCLPGVDTVKAWQRFTMPASVEELADRTPSEPQKTGASICPESVDLGFIDTSATGSALGSYSGDLAVTGTSSIDWSFISADPRLRISAAKTSADRYRLVIELRAAGLKTGLYSGVIRVIPDGKMPGVPASMLSVIARIRSSISVLPSSLFLGVLARGQIVDRGITISSRAGYRPQGVLRVTSSRPQFASAQISRSQDSIICHFDGTKALGNQSGYFDVVNTVTGEGARIIFIAFISRAYGKQPRVP